MFLCLFPFVYCCLFSVYLLLMPTSVALLGQGVASEDGCATGSPRGVPAGVGGQVCFAVDCRDFCVT